MLKTSLTRRRVIESLSHWAIGPAVPGSCQARRPFVDSWDLEVGIWDFLAGLPRRSALRDCELPILGARVRGGSRGVRLLLPDPFAQGGDQVVQDLQVLDRLREVRHVASSQTAELGNRRQFAQI